ncbi:MATE family efflux transporter [Salmonella enterica]|nr:MATE family efflux transporter [Salmonella enterica]
MGLAMLTVVGQCVGAGRKDEADRYAKRLLGAAYAGLIVINLPMAFFAEDVIGLYGLSPEVSDLARLMTLTHGICAMLWWPLSFTLPNALRASGHAMFTMCVSMATMWTIRVGMSYVFDATGIFGLTEAMGWPRSYGAEGTWIAMVMDWVVRLSLFIWCYKRWIREPEARTDNE